MPGKISLFSLVLLIVSAIDSIRTLPTSALYGSPLLFFFILSALFFLFPVAFISAEFSSRYPDQGGVFHWIRHAFGEKIGVLAVWLQWINTMVWYPTMLLFIAGTSAHLLSPSLAENRLFLSILALSVFWALTILNLRGIHVSARINSICGIVGTLVPMIFLIGLGFFWILNNHPVAISFSEVIPTCNWRESGTILVTIMASFLGMELAGVYVGDIENPTKNFPRAIFYSVFILLTTLILGALAVAVVIPKGEIHFIDGVMQTFSVFFQAFGMPFLTPILALLIVIGSTAGSVNWLLSPAQGVLQSAEFGFLPSFFLKKNRYGVPVRILFFQAILVSVFCTAIQAIPSINAFYWFLMALSTGLYMIMYVLLFLAALVLKRPAAGYQIPRGFRTISCISGLFSSLVTLIFGFVPGPNTTIDSGISYALLIGAGFLMMILPITFLWGHQKRRKIFT